MRVKVCKDTTLWIRAGTSAQAARRGGFFLHLLMFWGEPVSARFPPEWRERQKMSQTRMTNLSPAKRKRLLKNYGPCPAGYTHQDLERFLDLLYGLYSYLYTPEELRQIIVSDPFDQAEPPRRLKLVDFAAWLEAILA
jgi:hypothetical protein